VRTLRFRNRSGGGTTDFALRAEEGEVWVTLPVRVQLGTSHYRLRFEAVEALQLAEALVETAGEVVRGRG
jgi:hypothetical protein